MENHLNGILKLLLPFISFVILQNPYLNGQTISQSSNFYFYQSSDHLTFVSSLDGLNIFNGLSNKVYRHPTHNMLGNNIQSDFYEDEHGNIWFAVYQGVCKYIPELDSFENFQASDKLGYKIKTDYRVVSLSSDTLWFMAKEYLGSLNIHSNEIYQLVEVNLEDFHWHSIYKLKEKVIVTGAGYEGIAQSEIIKDSMLGAYLKISNEKVRSALQLKDKILFGTFDGSIIKYDLNSNSFIEIKSFDGTINSIKKHKNGVLINVERQGNFFFDLKNFTSQRINLLNEKIKPTGLDYTACFISSANILWEGVANEGPKWIDLDKQKFNFIGTPNGVQNISLIGIDSVILGIRKLGFIYLIDNEIRNRTFNVKKVSSHTPIGNLLSFDRQYLFYFNGINQLKLDDFKISEAYSGSNIQDYISNMVNIHENLILATDDSCLLKADFINERVVYDTIFTSPSDITNLHAYDNHLYASQNDERILVFFKSKDQYEKKENSLEIIGELKFVGNSLRNDSLLISTTDGLYIANKNNHSHRQIIDQDGHLAQTIYAAYPDNNGYIWCSSNSGILRYDPRTNHVHQFTEADGIQGQEYNTNAHLQLEDGTILFGGVNGLNIFHPDSVKLSQDPAPVILTEYQINDKVSTSQGVPLVLDALTVPYDSNTVSFKFHAIDYGDPQATRVKYQLSGVDKNYVTSTSAEGEARYPNLKPGSYTLSIIGSNSDKVWNKDVKTISITVIPPYWQTWWFRSLAFLFIGSTTFSAIRYYYNNKLKIKDLTLRQQALVIEKQQALEAERTRIAGEMHDDLGGGLTTIKFLSQKILRMAKDEALMPHIHKVIDHSTTLVSNMSEIIWAMNASFDTMDNLVAYSRRHTREYLDIHGIKLKFEVEGNTANINLSGEKRRNLFLIIKEALHNAVKHSSATQFMIKYIVEEELVIVLQDNGRGLPSEIDINSNGLRNMQKRISNIGGKLEINNTQTGLTININLRLEG